jgi:hypothetical protein
VINITLKVADDVKKIRAQNEHLEMALETKRDNVDRMTLEMARLQVRNV